MAKDVVCGMDIDEKKAKFKADRGGKTYFFCSEACLKKFQGDPKHK